MILKKIKRLIANNQFLFTNSVKSFLIKTSGIGIGFLLQIYLARILEINSYGIYVYVLAWLSILSLISRMGLDQASKKFIPKYISEKESPDLSEFLRFSTTRVSLVSLLLGGFVLIYVGFGGIDLNYEEQITFFLGSFLLLLISQSTLISSFIESLKKISFPLSQTHIVRPLLLISGLYIISKFVKVEAFTALYINIVCTAFVLTLMIFYLKRSLPIKHQPRTKIDPNWTKVALPLFLTSGIHLLMTQTDIILLGFFLDKSSVGVYASASKITQLAVFGLTAVNVVVSPLISELYSKNKIKKLQEVVSSAAMITTVFTIPIVLVLAIFSKDLLILFGKDFVAGDSALKILLIGQTINSFTGSVAFLMTMTNYHNQSFYILLIASFFNITLNLVLIPFLGMEGAAISTAVTTIFWNITMYVYMKKKLNIDSSFLGLIKNNHVEKS